MRGALFPGVFHGPVLGIIPADAGSTLHSNTRSATGQDHPRGCGEHARSAHPMRVIAGSSPRMRGARDRPGVQVPDHRIIPADAGSTMHNMTNTQHSTGSSPRMRGALYKYGLRLFPRQDHPRGCGEHVAHIILGCFLEGSSPRMRGAPPPIWAAFSCLRIIPADAGSTQGEDGKESRERDHPRGCGEHVGRMRELAMNEGSSPRMRGAPALTARPTTPVRIIPADAGSTRNYHGLCRCHWDHPRGCGEHRSRKQRMTPR